MPNYKHCWGNDINWTTDISKSEKRCAKFCFLGRQEWHFLNRIVTGDEKWIFFENPKRRKSWVDLGQPSTSTASPNRFGKKTMLCIWWDQKGVVYHKLLEPGETINTIFYYQQMMNLNHALIEKWPEWAIRHGKVILQKDNAPSNKRLFSSMSHTLSMEHFNNYGDVEKWFDQPTRIWPLQIAREMGKMFD